MPRTRRPYSAEFRRRLVENPNDALTTHGFALESNELDEIKRISASLAEPGSDVEKKLVRIAEAYGPWQGYWQLYLRATV